MNLGQAVAVCLYELVRDNAAMVRQDAMQRASGAALERMTQALLSSLKESGYMKPGMDATTKEKVRRLVRRMELSEEDAELWTGMLAKPGNRVKGKGRNQ